MDANQTTRVLLDKPELILKTRIRFIGYSSTVTALKKTVPESHESGT